MKLSEPAWTKETSKKPAKNGTTKRARFAKENLEMSNLCGEHNSVRQYDVSEQFTQAD